MVDTRTPEQRSRIMRAVGAKHTGPELLLRRLLHKTGYRYRLHSNKLPGKPDIAFPVRKKAIFVHGCFWHGHGCAKGQLPKSRPEYWAPKIAANKQRDTRHVGELTGLGWRALVIWQCELTDPSAALQRVKKFLDNG